MAGSPALNQKVFNQFRTGFAQDQSGQMTIEGTTNKGLFLLGLTILSGLAAWIGNQQVPGLGMMLLLVGALGGFITAIITVYRPQSAPISAPIYALLEGLALGTISSLFEKSYRGIVLTAVILTVGLLLIMLMLYRARVLRATPGFTKAVIAATGAICIAYFVSMIAGFFGVNDLLGLNSSGPIGIVISLVIIGIACSNFILDFDLIERGANQGAPKFMEWYGAFGVLVTLFWLYLEVLRLLSKTQQRN